METFPEDLFETEKARTLSSGERLVMRVLEGGRVV